VTQERLLRFTFMFLIGSLMFLYAGRIPMRGPLAAVSAAVLTGGLLLGPDYRVVAAPSFAYLCLWFVVIRPPVRTPRSDFSYGLYVYHWPILQILAVSGAAGLGEPIFLLLGLTLALGAAVLSWRFVERPALGLKDAAWVTAGRSWAAQPAGVRVEARSSPAPVPATVVAEPVQTMFTTLVLAPPVLRAPECPRTIPSGIRIR
jgi:peptidoglycan/LPS O-acetylase OafA/YrhL